jgi:hypothetical protein
MIFKIKKGHHFANFHIGLTFKDVLNFTAVFDDNCVYPYLNKDTNDLNKLYGFSDDWYHMKNSIRIGWRCIDGKTIELWGFIHNNGVESWKYICTVLPNEVIKCQILIYDNQYLLMVYNGTKSYSITMPRTSNWKFLRYTLHPYFGGNNVAPNDMIITIENK